MNLSDALPGFIFVLVLGSYLLVLVAIVWGLYIAYLLTRALRKYLRS